MPNAKRAAAPESDIVSKVDLSEAKRFLDLFGPTHTFQTFCENPDKSLRNENLKAVLHGTLDRHAEVLAGLNDRHAGVFAAINETDGTGRKRSNIVRVRAIQLDLDGEPVEPVHDCALKPHAIIESSPGRYHVYWLVDALPLDQFEDVTRSLAYRFNGDDSVAMLTACARVPGFFHCKDIEHRFRTRIVEINEDLPPYTPEVITAEFPPTKKRLAAAGGSRLVLPAGAPLVAAEEFLARRHAAGKLPLLRHYRGAFYRYTGTHFVEAPDEQLEADLYEFLNCALAQDKAGNVGPYNPTKGKVSEVLHALRRGTRTLVPKSRQTPCWLEADESKAADDLIACRNGILNLKTRELLPHDPTFFSMHCVPLDYDPRPPEPRGWLKFLEDVWPTDEEAEMCLQEIFGYVLTADTRQHKLFLLCGPKRGGKGTLVSILEQLLGRDAVVYPTLKSLAGEFGRWPLIDKKLAVIADARLGPKSDAHAVAEHLLSISGGDPQTINRKNQSFWSGYLGVRFVITTNELPAIADASGTLSSRFVLLRMTESFFGREDVDLKEKLKAELPGILLWALNGLDRLRKRGRFKLPASSKEALRQLEDLGSPVGAFLRDWCDVGADRRANVKTLYAAYRVWADEAGHKPVPRHVFGKALHSLCPALQTSGGGAARTYIGVALSESGEEQYREAEGARSRR